MEVLVEGYIEKKRSAVSTATLVSTLLRTPGKAYFCSEAVHSGL
jgi:hypothetical protein